MRPQAKDGFERSEPSSLDTLSLHEEPLTILANDSKKADPVVVAAGLFGLVVLGFGVALYSQFDKLALDPEWRPKMATLCGILQCTLPKTYSTDFLKVTSRSTRDMGEKIMVDAVIFNTNPHFDMPFPHLLMSFSSLEGQLLAEFDVSPEEYRQGELKKFELFPSNTSAHIQFALPNPGPESVNFSITFDYPNK